MPAWPSARPNLAAWRSFEGAGTRALFLRACESGEHISSAGPGWSSDLTPPSGHAILPLWEKEVDPLGYGLASLGREQSLLFGDVQHRLGDLVQRRLIHLQASGCEGVARAQFDVAVLEGQEGHEEVDQVAGHQVTLSKATWKGELVCMGGGSKTKFSKHKQQVLLRRWGETDSAPWDSIVSALSRCSRSSMPMSSRFWPECQKSRATSLIVAPPMLLSRQRAHSTTCQLLMLYIAGCISCQILAGQNQPGSFMTSVTFSTKWGQPVHWISKCHEIYAVRGEVYFAWF